MDPEHQVGIAAGVEGAVVEVDRLTRAGRYADRVAGTHRAVVREVDRRPTPVVPGVDQRVGVDRLVNLGKGTRRKKQETDSCQKGQDAPHTMDLLPAG